ncbi:NRDE family protein [Planomicrobium sp. YIM 101495]|uniref:NRDE family protein n=1 Tax=Planomicrobium sp. YIM 101495 TaxID=2665160 RepID=UPI0012B92093|nr:NRDE family protein [Planomicrobium sp. YIM 101495]MTD30538.1 hypothetical protein [Planomicrobium sp. YIM 101495]
MCLIAFRFQDHPKYKLILAANRDEFYARPTAPADFWTDEPTILAGRDLQGHGTWLGVSKEGRIAALTNYRAPAHMAAGKKTRGAIVRDFLMSSDSPAEYMAKLVPEDYAGFNFLCGSADELFYFNNVDGHSETVSPGVHALSNAFLNTPWPKVEKAKVSMKTITEQNGQINPDELFGIMADADQAHETTLPDTGVGLELERSLSSLFIRLPDYGTRCSTVLLVENDGTLHFAERRYEEGEKVGENHYMLQTPSI